MNRKILLADDGPAIRQIVALALSGTGFEIESVSTGTEALERLQAESYGLVLADVHMPGADGYEVCRDAKARQPMLPVLLLVGSLEPFDAATSRGCGADGVLKKPFEPSELREKVIGLLGNPVPAPANDPSGESILADAATGDLADPPVSNGPAAAADPPFGDVAPAAPAAAVSTSLSDDDVERVARRVAEILGDRILRDIVWDVLPDMAEVVVRDRLRELESQIDPS